MTELILGAGGMLARGLARERPEARSFGIAELDVTDSAALARAVVRPVAAGARGVVHFASPVLDTSLYGRLTGETPRRFTGALDEHLRLRAEAAGT